MSNSTNNDSGENAAQEAAAASTPSATGAVADGAAADGAAANGAAVEDSVKKSGIKKIIATISSKFSKLRQKKFWIPLVLGHAIMFSGMGYFAYEEARYIRTSVHLLETVNTALKMNDPVLLTSVLNIPVFITNTDSVLRESLEVSPDFSLYIGKIPESQALAEQLASALLDIIKGNDPSMPFNEKLDIIPSKIASQLRSTPFTINEELSAPDLNMYVLETELKTIKWGNYPFMLSAVRQEDKWNITEIINLPEIIEIYDTELARARTQTENRIAAEKAKLVDQVAAYLPTPTCIASIADHSGQKVLIIRVDSPANNAEKDMISWSVDATLTFEDGSLFQEEYLKINGLFPPQEPITNTWNMILSDEDVKKSSGKKLLCAAEAIYVNLPKGEFYQIAE